MIDSILRAACAIAGAALLAGSGSMAVAAGTGAGAKVVVRQSPGGAAAEPEVKRPKNYLENVVNTEAIAAFFEVPADGVIREHDFEAQLLAAGILPEDAAMNSYGTRLTPDEVREAEVDAELSEYSLDYFGTAGLSTSEVRKRVARQGGYTPMQYLAYARVAFGRGRCDAARVGTHGCYTVVADIQTSLFKNLDWIFNIRYIGNYVKWYDTFALNREDIATRLVFDLVAKKLAGLPHNPLRDIPIDVSKPGTWKCRQLEQLFRNGAAFESFLNTLPGMPRSISLTLRHAVDGNSERAANRVTGIVDDYHYGMFYFMEGLNCARVDPNNMCWPGEPKMADYLFVDKGVQPPLESGQYAWSCSEIATIMDVIASNPYVKPYDVLATESAYQFDPETYPLRNAPLDLTAEDVLLFMLALSNGLPNMPGLASASNQSQADTEAMFNDDALLNPEFEFQLRVLPTVYSSFLSK